MASNTKSLRKRLQRQLEFYLSASNLRQDKFLQQHMDEHGFLPASLFLSFNKMKALRATEPLVLEAARKSDLLRVDDASACVAPLETALDWQRDGDADARTIYVEGYDVESHDHDSLRKVFAPIGKVNLVSMPRFAQSRKFKGFAFVEFATPEAAAQALEATASSQDEPLRSMRGMSKSQWLEMKEKLKAQLQRGAAEDGDTTVVDSAPVAKPLITNNSLKQVAKAQSTPSKEAKGDVAGHVRFRDEDSDNEDEDEALEDQPPSSKRPRVATE